jgi:tRNA 2-thiouridine synthesizing protein A
MNDKKSVDARGLSCPQPVLLTKKAIESVDKGIIEILVDSGTSRDNVSRFAKKSGWSFEVVEQPGEEFKVILKK